MKAYIFFILGILLAPVGSQAEEIRDINFPIEEGYDYRFTDTYGAARSGGRSHLGTDIMTDQMTPLVAAVDGTINYLVDRDKGWGLALYIKGNDGYSYRYLHINNDTPGTDDGKQIRAYAFPKNIVRGSRVKAGQTVAFAGDSGNAEWTGHHLHFEIWTSSKQVINSYPSLMAAIDDNYELVEETASSVPSVLSYQFDRSLKLGDRGQDVLELQKYLNTAGFTVTLSGAGSKGSETTYFGPATQKALIKYQQAQGISPSSGYFGPITRSKINGGLKKDDTGSQVSEQDDTYSNIQAGWLVKEKNSPKVYYVDDLLNLRWLTSEAAASSRFSTNWSNKLKVVNSLSKYEVGKDLR